MTVPPTPSPSPIEVFVHTDPTPLWQTLAPYAPLAAALIAAWIALRTLQQRSTSDNRSEWWRRAQWALDASTSEDPKRREMGQQAINRLGQSPLAGPDDLDFLEIGTEDALEDADAARRAEAADQVGIADSADARLTTVDGPEGPRDNGNESGHES